MSMVEDLGGPECRQRFDYDRPGPFPYRLPRGLGRVGLHHGYDDQVAPAVSYVVLGGWLCTATDRCICGPVGTSGMHEEHYGVQRLVPVADIVPALVKAGVVDENGKDVGVDVTRAITTALRVLTAAPSNGGCGGGPESTMCPDPHCTECGPGAPGGGDGE